MSTIYAEWIARWREREKSRTREEVLSTALERLERQSPSREGLKEMIQSGVMGPTTYLGWLYEINCIGGDYESFSENQKLAFYEERMTWLEYSAEKRQDGWWVFCPEEHRVGWQPYYELGPFESYFLALKTFLDRYGY